ncbi:hypothetical protein D3C78_1185460 [compost metagenome]
MEVIHQVAVVIGVRVTDLSTPRLVFALIGQEQGPVSSVDIPLDLDLVLVGIRPSRRKEGVGIHAEENWVVIQVTKDLATLDGDNDVAIPHYLQVRHVARDLHTVNVVQIHQHLRLFAHSRERCPRLP